MLALIVIAQFLPPEMRESFLSPMTRRLGYHGRGMERMAVLSYLRQLFAFIAGKTAFVETEPS